MRIGSSATTVIAPGGGCGAAIAKGVCTGLASVTRGAEAEEYGLEAAAPEDREVGAIAQSHWKRGLPWHLLLLLLLNYRRQ